MLPGISRFRALLQHAELLQQVPGVPVDPAGALTTSGEAGGRPAPRLPAACDCTAGGSPLVNGRLCQNCA